MDYRITRNYSFPSFSQRAQTNDSQQRLWLPSQEDVRDNIVDDEGNDRRHLPVPPSAYPSAHSKQLSQHTPWTRPRLQGVASSPRILPSTAELNTRGHLILPALLVCVPMTLLVGMLLVLVYVYQLDTHPDMFDHSWVRPGYASTTHFLVNYPATRLVFAASFLSTVAPLLVSFMMTLWTIRVAAKLREASIRKEYGNLPTPHQLALLIGICLASYDQLRLYLSYISSRGHRSRVPPTLRNSGWMFILATCLALSIFAADTALHYTTSTIEFDRVTTVNTSMNAFGRGLSSICLSLDRIKSNFGQPCSLTSPNFTDPDLLARYNEIPRLTANTSAESRIVPVPVSGLSGGELAIILPQISKVDASIDYRVSTVGIHSQCRLISPEQCRMFRFSTNSSLPNSTFTQFNCSTNFYGVLGMAPNISPYSGKKADDSNISPLAFKPSTTLNWMFSKDPDLQTLYNPLDINATTNQRSNPLKPMSDVELINPFYFGLAARIGISGFTPGSTIANDSRVLTNGKSYTDMIISCGVSSYDVEYTWYRGRIQDVTYMATPNGTILEIFHAPATLYFTAGNPGTDIQNILTHAGLAGNSTDTFTRTWSKMFSVKVLAVIGPYLSARGNIQEQVREHLLIAQVHKGILGFLVGCSLLYTLVGVALVIAAYRTCTADIKIIADRLSLVGLANAAFGDSQEITPDSTRPGSSQNDFRSRDVVQRQKVRVSKTEFRAYI